MDHLEFSLGNSLLEYPDLINYLFQFLNSFESGILLIGKKWYRLYKIYLEKQKPPEKIRYSILIPGNSYYFGSEKYLTGIHELYLNGNVSKINWTKLTKLINLKTLSLSNINLTEKLINYLEQSIITKLLIVQCSSDLLEIVFPIIPKLKILKIVNIEGLENDIPKYLLTEFGSNIVLTNTMFDFKNLFQCPELTELLFRRIKFRNLNFDPSKYSVIWNEITISVRKK